MTLSETETPNGGWQFRDAAYNFVIERPDSVSLTLKQATERIIACRLKNSAITAAQNRSTDFDQVKQELMNFTRARLGLPPDDSPPVPKWNPAGRAARPVGIISNVAAGLKVMAAWLGDGLTPVTNDHAERRAQVCAVCPMNQLGNFWQRIEASAAERLKNVIQVKSNLDLKTSQDDKLFSCQACDCWIPLKIFCEIDHISKHTSEDVWKRLHHKCWIRSETGRNIASPASEFEGVGQEEQGAPAKLHAEI